MLKIKMPVLTHSQKESICIIGSMGQGEGSKESLQRSIIHCANKWILPRWGSRKKTKVIF